MSPGKISIGILRAINFLKVDVVDVVDGSRQDFYSNFAGHQLLKIDGVDGVDGSNVFLKVVSLIFFYFLSMVFQ